MIKNLTPHPVSVVLPDGATVTLPPYGPVARAEQKDEPAGSVEIQGQAVPVVRSTYGEVVGLPLPEPGVFLVVSALVAQAAPGRDDLLVPSGPVRDDEGRIVACQRFATLAKRVC
ncbi:MAG: hypothetical protein ACP5VR_13020 [Acidimicrobiales bacterium]